MSAVFLVEHHVQDKEAWGKLFEKNLSGAKEKTAKEMAEDPMWDGNACVMTGSSVDGDFCFCIWKMPEGSTLEDFKTFIDKFTDGGGAKNVCYKVEASMGAQNLTSEGYILDLMKLATEGKVQGYSDDGELVYVHHSVVDKDAWDKMFGEKMGAIKGKSNTAELSEAWELGGYKGVMYCGLGDKDASCMWSVPKGTSVEDYQQMIDKFVGPPGKNVGYKLEPANCMGGRGVHPDFYSQEALASAAQMDATL